MDDLLRGLGNREWLSGIFERIGLTPFGAVILMAALNLSIDLPLALHFGALLPSERSKGLASEPADWLYELLIHPVILGYFCWFQKAGEQLFTELVRREILESDTHLHEVLVKYRKRLQSRWISYVCAAMSLLLVGWFVLAFAPSSVPSPYPSPPYPSWVTVHPAIAWIRSPVLFIVFYALAIVIYDLTIIILSLNDLLRNQRIRVEPLHPDKAGGLGFIGRFSANLCYFIGALGLLLSVRVIQAPVNLYDMRNYMFMLACAVYLLLAPTMFFLPLWTAHTAMVTYRDRLLRGISTKFDSALAQLRSPRRESAHHLEAVPNGEDSDQTKAVLEKLRQFDEVRTLIMNQVPVWPFNIDSLRKFFSVILSPLVPVAISAITDLVSKSLLGK